MSSVVVTGGAGYLGSVLVPQLLHHGHRVTVVDSLLYKQSSLLECCADPNFQMVNADCRDEAVIQEVIKGQDYIFPLAAIVGFPACNKDRIAAITTNLDAVKLILKHRTETQRIIFPCTNSGYGKGRGNEYCTEKSPIEPVSLYGRTKVEAEKSVLESGNSVTFRFATLFGASPRMRTDLLVNDFVYRALTDRSLVVYEGHFNRNYLHVRDAAAAFLFAMEHFDEMKGQTFNCGLSDSNLSKIELCEKIKEHIPAFTFFEAAAGHDPDQRNYLVSNQKIEALGFLPNYSLDDGIEELKKAYSIINKASYGNA